MPHKAIISLKRASSYQKFHHIYNFRWLLPFLFSWVYSSSSQSMCVCTCYLRDLWSPTKIRTLTTGSDGLQHLLLGKKKKKKEKKRDASLWKQEMEPSYQVSEFGEKLRIGTTHQSGPSTRDAWSRVFHSTNGLSLSFLHCGVKMHLINYSSGTGTPESRAKSVWCIYYLF